MFVTVSSTCPEFTFPKLTLLVLLVVDAAIFDPVSSDPLLYWPNALDSGVLFDQRRYFEIPWTPGFLFFTPLLA